MPKTLWNVDHMAVIVHFNEPGVHPGESREFSDEEIEAGFTGAWSDVDPRSGLPEEKAFKKRRDAPPAKVPEVRTTPAESGLTKEA